MLRHPAGLSPITLLMCANFWRSDAADYKPGQHCESSEPLDYCELLSKNDAGSDQPGHRYQQRERCQPSGGIAGEQATHRLAGALRRGEIRGLVACGQDHAAEERQ